MSKTIEYRVRAVTRYVVTEHDPNNNTVTEIAEVAHGGTASRVAESFAAAVNADAAALGPARAVPLTDPLPGKVMRAKLNLTARAPQVSLAWGGEAKGRTETRENSQGREYVWVDPKDPANYKLDGETISFHAVCPPTCDPNGAPENLIFGEATPNAQFSMHIRNPDVLAALELGRAYYVDFTPAPTSA